MSVEMSHFQRLWKAMVKLVEKHLKGIFNETNFISTFEEFTTTLCKIKDCQISGFLIRISKNPDDLEGLAPRHFLCNQYWLRFRKLAGLKGVYTRGWQQPKAIHQTLCRGLVRDIGPLLIKVPDEWKRPSSSERTVNQKRKRRSLGPSNVIRKINNFRLIF